MIEMLIDSIRVSLMNNQRVVILKEKGTNYYLPIWIGPAEADSTLGGTLNYVVVNDLQNDTFYAKLYISVNGQQMEVDSRPSDAIALAVRTGVPIYVEESVLDKAGIMLDEETGKPVSEGKPKKKEGLNEQEMKGLSAFKDFINTLDLDDFKKRKS